MKLNELILYFRAATIGTMQYFFAMIGLFIAILCDGIESLLFLIISLYNLVLYHQVNKKMSDILGEERKERTVKTILMSLLIAALLALFIGGVIYLMYQDR